MSGNYGKKDEMTGIRSDRDSVRSPQESRAFYAPPSVARWLSPPTDFSPSPNYRWREFAGSDSCNFSFGYFLECTDRNNRLMCVDLNLGYILSHEIQQH